MPGRGAYPARMRCTLLQVVIAAAAALVAGLAAHPADAQSRGDRAAQVPNTPVQRHSGNIADSAAQYFRSGAWHNPDWHDICLTPDYVAKPALCDKPVDRIPMTRNMPRLITRLRPGIDNSDLLTQYSLATHYDRGQYIPRDLSEAAKWYATAARRGHATSQFELGTMYEEGAGVARSNPSAYSLYRSAADHGYGPAMRAEQAMIAGRQYRVRVDGATLYAKAQALSGYGPRVRLPGGMDVLVFDRYPGWYHVYVRDLARWGWVRRDDVSLRLG